MTSNDHPALRDGALPTQLRHGEAQQWKVAATLGAARHQCHGFYGPHSRSRPDCAAFACWCDTASRLSVRDARRMSSSHPFCCCAFGTALGPLIQRAAQYMTSSSSHLVTRTLTVVVTCRQQPQMGQVRFQGVQVGGYHMHDCGRPHHRTVRPCIACYNIHRAIDRGRAHTFARFISFAQHSCAVEGTMVTKSVTTISICSQCCGTPC